MGRLKKQKLDEKIKKMIVPINDVLFISHNFYFGKLTNDPDEENEANTRINYKIFESEMRYKISMNNRDYLTAILYVVIQHRFDWLIKYTNQILLELNELDYITIVDICLDAKLESEKSNSNLK